MCVQAEFPLPQGILPLNVCTSATFSGLGGDKGVLLRSSLSRNRSMKACRVSTSLMRFIHISGESAHRLVTQEGWCMMALESAILAAEVILLEIFRRSSEKFVEPSREVAFSRHALAKLCLSSRS